MMQRAWTIACALGAVAAACVVAMIACDAVRATRPPPPEPAAAERIDDVRVSVPGGWQSLPVIARRDPATAATFSEGFMSRTAHFRSKLGPLAVSWNEEQCTAGGSSCGPYIPNWTSLAVGDPDEDGAPLLGPSVDCTGSTPWEEVSMTPKRRSCSLETLALRQSPDGRTFIVSFRDPDDEDRLVVAFVRAKVRPSLGTRRGRASLAFALFPVAAFAAGVFALVRARRHRRAAAAVAPITGAVYRETEPAADDPLRSRARGRATWLSGLAILAFVTSAAAATTMLFT